MSLACLVCIAGALMPVHAAPAVGTAASLFPEGEARAWVKDGLLIGIGTERVVHRPDGGLSIVRERRYRRVKHPDTGKVYELPEPWSASATLEVSPSLRLIRSDTRARFFRSVDKVLGKDVLSDAIPNLFDIDRTTLRAVAGGSQLEHRAFLGKEQVDQDRYDYDANDVPLEIVGLYIASRLNDGKARFEFDLLVGDSSHGVSAEVTRTRDLRRYAKDYAIDPKWLRTDDEVSMVDLRLSSPIKYLFFPHHFYMVFAATDPSRLLMLWGGDPDEHLQAFRLP